MNQTLENNDAKQPSLASMNGSKEDAFENLLNLEQPSEGSEKSEGLLCKSKLCLPKQT